MPPPTYVQSSQRSQLRSEMVRELPEIREDTESEREGSGRERGTGDSGGRGEECEG